MTVINGIAAISAMTTLTDMTPETLNDRMAEAARFAVLNRLMPVLRHDVAGAMQPPRMLLMVLEKRLQNAEPDLQAIRATVASVSTLSKQATSNCMGALGWVASAEDMCINLRDFIDEVAGLLTLELAVNGLMLHNAITDETATASRSFLRSVVSGALLAFCDQHTDGGTLQVTTVPDGAGGGKGNQLQMRMLAGPDKKGDGLPMPEVVRRYRLIDWPDVQAMAQSSGVQMTRGDDWLMLGLPGA